MRIWQEAQVHTFIRTLTGTAVAAALSAVLIVGTVDHARAQSQGAQPAAQPAPAEKKPKDTAEYDLYNSVIKDINAKDGQKAVTDLNAWTQKYPDSDYKDDRLAYYQTAYSLMNQPDKVVEYGLQLMNKDLNALFKDNKAGALNVYFLTAVAITQVKNPTPEQLATGEKAAKLLLAFVSSPANKPANVSDADWAAARAQTEPVAKAALVSIAGYPGDQLMAKAAQDPKDSDHRSPITPRRSRPTAPPFRLTPTWACSLTSWAPRSFPQKKPATYPQGLFFIARAVPWIRTRAASPTRRRGPISMPT